MGQAGRATPASRTTHTWASDTLRLLTRLLTPALCPGPGGGQTMALGLNPAGREAGTPATQGVLVLGGC